MREHDVIVIGGGHNGLIAAGYLAKAGVDVCVCEALDEVGGDIVTNELTLPGFKHDRGATMHGVIQGNPLLANDELELKSKYGLKYIYPELSFATTFPDGTAICSYVDIDKTCASIAKTCGQRDADAYRGLFEALSPASAFINAGSFSEPPAFGAMMAQFDSNPIGRNVIESMFKSAYEVACDWFEDPKMIMHITKMCTEMFFNPEDKGTAFYLYMLIPAAHMAPYALPVGGSGELSNALARCVEDNGGTILLNSPVEKITVSQGAATGVVLKSGEEIKARKRVLSSVDPRLMFGEGRMIEGALEPSVQQKIDRIADPFNVGMMIHCALDGVPKWSAGDELLGALMVEPCPNLDAYRAEFDAIRYGRLPQEVCPLVCTQSLLDPSRAPQGKHTLYVGPYGPWNFADGSPDRWDEVKESYADLTMRNLSQYITNLDEIVIDRFVDTPLDMERWNPNNVHGGVTGPASHMYQMFSNRPITEMGRYRTPVENLWICGMATHPSGGVTGGARAMVPSFLEDMGIDFEDVID